MGRVAHSGGFGATDSTTFRARQTVETNRQVIGTYTSANVHMTRMPSSVSRPFSTNTKPDISPLRSATPTHTSFREPPKKFNPYA